MQKTPDVKPTVDDLVDNCPSANEDVLLSEQLQRNIPQTSSGFSGNAEREGNKQNTSDN